MHRNDGQSITLYLTIWRTLHMMVTLAISRIVASDKQIGLIFHVSGCACARHTDSDSDRSETLLINQGRVLIDEVCHIVQHTIPCGTGT